MKKLGHLHPETVNGTKAVIKEMQLIKPSMKKHAVHIAEGNKEACRQFPKSL